MAETAKRQPVNVPDPQTSPTSINERLTKESIVETAGNSFDVTDSERTLNDIYSCDFRASRFSSARGSTEARLVVASKKSGIGARLKQWGYSLVGLFMSMKPWFRFASTLLFQIVSSIIAHPGLFLTSPLNFWILVVGLPTAGVVLLFVAPLLYALLHNRLFTRITQTISQQQDNLSLVNWSFPEMYSHQQDDLVRRAKKAMCMHSKYPYSVIAAVCSPAELKDSAKFNVDIARWLLLVSGIMYERDSNQALEATKAYYESPDTFFVSSAGPVGLVKNKLGEKEKKVSLVSTIGGFMFGGESRIEKQMRVWDVQFQPISHLKRLYSPFAGLWWNTGTDPFIVVAFKGTTPFDYSEFLVDASFLKTDASAFLWGCCHQGFYDAIFPQVLPSDDKQQSPYGNIIQAIRIKAKELHRAIKDQHPHAKIPVYVTGHSLGAALASLFYARLMKAPHDLGPLVDIRQAYVFGCPAVGDVKFAQGFASAVNSSYLNHFGLWRVIDDSDIVTKAPLNYSNPLSGRPSTNPFVKKGSLVDYCVIGNGVRLFGDGTDPQVSWKMPTSTNVFDLQRPSSGRLSNPIGRAISWMNKFNYGNNAMRAELLCPKFLRDHFPTEYFRNLSKAEHFFRSREEFAG